MMYVTYDETPASCERFLQAGGMEIFLQCNKEFSDVLNNEFRSILKNMTELMRNVAEVPNLRQQLMTMAYVSEVSMMLDSNLLYVSIGLFIEIIGNGQAKILKKVKLRTMFVNIFK